MIALQVFIPLDQTDCHTEASAESHPETSSARHAERSEASVHCHTERTEISINLLPLYVLTFDR